MRVHWDFLDSEPRCLRTMICLFKYVCLQITALCLVFLSLYTVYYYWSYNDLSFKYVSLQITLMYYTIKHAYKLKALLQKK